MKIMLTGATGLIGSALGPKLAEAGHHLVVVTRDAERAREHLTFHAEIIEWDLNAKALPPSSFAGVQAVIHLAGESIAQRWTSVIKKKITESRAGSARNLLRHCPPEVETLVTASAVGIYGDRGAEELTENSQEGHDFLADVCRAWEAEVRGQNRRTVILRLGLVLSRKGGVLPRLTSLFQRGFGAILGNGRQWMSYISLEDLVRLIAEAVEKDKYRGVYNAVCDDPVTNADFTRTLSLYLKSVRLPRVPGFVLRIVLGEMAALVLSSQRVRPVRLQEAGFRFHDRTLEDIFDRELHAWRNHYALFFAEQFIPRDIDEVFGFFANHENLEKITPDILNFQTEKMSTARVEKDTVIDYRLKIRGIPLHWRTLIKTWNRPHEFVDTQVRGPYAYWRHTHRFQEVRNGTLMTDEVRYRVPLGVLGRMVAGAFVEKDVSQIFAFRRRMIARHDFDGSAS